MISLIFSLIFVNYFILKNNFSSLGITNIFNLLVVLVTLSIPMIILGVIFSKIYLAYLDKEIGHIVFTHTIGYITGAVVSINLITYFGANILSLVCILLVLTLLLTKKIINYIFLTAFGLISPGSILMAFAAPHAIPQLKESFKDFFL